MRDEPMGDEPMGDAPMGSEGVEDLLRRETPQVLASLVRRYGNFHLAEDATQEALIAAADAWPTKGIPNNPRAWLIRVAQRRLIDLLRAESARQVREERYTDLVDQVAPTVDHDDSLELLFMCCHPSLSDASAVSLTLRAVGGLSTEEIARAFLTTPSTIGQRISRAKATVDASREELASPTDRGPRRLDRVLTVLYLIFNEGYSATSGGDLGRVDLAAEAIRLTRMLLRACPGHAEVGGLLALQLLHHARHAARERNGEPVPLSEQDRGAWDRGMIDEGRALLSAALARGPLGRYQVLAAISALHDEASGDADTDWVQVLALYDLLLLFDPSPMVLVSRAVAVAKVKGTRAGLEELRSSTQDKRLSCNHRPVAVEAHLMADAGHTQRASLLFDRAASLTRSLPERRYLQRRARELRSGPPSSSLEHPTDATCGNTDPST